VDEAFKPSAYSIVHSDKSYQKIYGAHRRTKDENGGMLIVVVMPTLSQLREQIECLEGVQRRRLRTVPICGYIDKALPYNGLPLGCIHEMKARHLAGAIAFAALLAARIPGEGPLLFAAPDRSFYPLGLLPYACQPKRWLHVTARRPEDLIWTVSEAVRCPRINAVLAIMPKTDFTFCRRLQLAAESSGTTGFLLGNASSAPASSAITRWRVSSVNGPPGRGFDEAFWELELSYCRGGRPGKWTVAWRSGGLERFRPLSPASIGPARQDTFEAARAKAG
jgi:protein ImuA